VWLAAGITDLRKGFDGLAALVQTVLDKDPFSGRLFCFRGRRGDLVKILWWDIVVALARLRIPIGQALHQHALPPSGSDGPGWHASEVSLRSGNGKIR
jgi:hypothetical protein